MTTHLYRTLCFAVLTTCHVSCVSVTSVTKVTPGRNPSGYRYALPQPYILAVPKIDGSVTFTEMSLPDLSQQYAINTFTFAAKNTLTIEADKLLLKKVVTTKDTTALAKQVLSSGGNIAKTQMEEEAKRRDTKTASETKAQEAIATKQLAVALAKAERDALPPDSKPDVIALADLKIRKAEIELEATRQQYSAILGVNVMSSKAAGVPGPVLFKVVDRGDRGVELVAVKIDGQLQPNFPTSTKKKSPTPNPRAVLVSPTTLDRKKLTSMEVEFAVIPEDAAFAVDSVTGPTPSEVIKNMIVNSVGGGRYRLTLAPLPKAGVFAISYTVRPAGSKTSIPGAATVVLVDQ